MCIFESEDMASHRKLAIQSGFAFSQQSVKDFRVQSRQFCGWKQWIRFIWLPFLAVIDRYGYKYTTFSQDQMKLRKTEAKEKETGKMITQSKPHLVQSLNQLWLLNYEIPKKSLIRKISLESLLISSRYLFIVRSILASFEMQINSTKEFLDNFSSIKEIR